MDLIQRPFKSLKAIPCNSETTIHCKGLWISPSSYKVHAGKPQHQTVQQFCISVTSKLILEILVSFLCFAYDYHVNFPICTSLDKLRSAAVIPRVDSRV